MIMCTKGRIGPSITKTSDFIAKNVKSTLYYGHNFFATHLGLKAGKISDVSGILFYMLSRKILTRKLCQQMILSVVLSTFLYLLLCPSFL